MPKETFYNLPAEKRQKIEAAAVNEFTEYAYDTASINRIIAAAGIPKGSFYQYFADKKDIYRHVIMILVEKKMAFLAPVMHNPWQDNFFDLLYKLYVAGLQFARSNPDLQKITSRIMADRHHPVFVELMQEQSHKADQVFQMLINQAIQRGELRSDLDTALISHMISTLNTAIADYYLEKVQADFSDDYLDFSRQLIEVLKYGIGQNKTRDQAGTNG